MWWLVGRRLSYEAFLVGRSLRSSPFWLNGIYSDDSPDDCDQPSRGLLVRLGEVRPAPAQLGEGGPARRIFTTPASSSTTGPGTSPTSKPVRSRSTGRTSCVMRTADSGHYGRVGKGSDGWGSPLDADVTVPLGCSPPNRARPSRSVIQVVAEATAAPAPECRGGAVAPEL